MIKNQCIDAVFQILLLIEYLYQNFSFASQYSLVL